ncbi:mucin-2-like [Gastrophryne carolinensis]
MDLEGTILTSKGCSSRVIETLLVSQKLSTRQIYEKHTTACVPGCICPPGLVYDDDNEACITEDKCPCFYDDIAYSPEEKIQIKCNNCVCRNRKWMCTNHTCSATCVMYGNGHFITFDQKHYIFDGECQYTLLQDYCSPNSSTGTFRIITDNIPCDDMGTICLRSFTFYLGDYGFLMNGNHIKLLHKTQGDEVPYQIHLMGIYLVVETKNGLLLIWDKKSNIFIKVSSKFEGKLCGLCGNYDGNANNDFTTRSNAVVANAEEFGDSWKLSPTCPDSSPYKDACLLSPHIHAWAQMKCGILKDSVFSACHPHVDFTTYYDACVSDSCACDTGGECDCFCTAIAAYAQACGEFNICVFWRNPTFCPIFCDYYNSKGDNDCVWHYKPCGTSCLKTCRNPSGKCTFDMMGLEGCYPQCPESAQFFDEDEMKCVAVCGCYDEDRKHYQYGDDIPSQKNCIVW